VTLLKSLTQSRPSAPHTNASIPPPLVSHVQAESQRTSIQSTASLPAASSRDTTTACTVLCSFRSTAPSIILSHCDSILLLAARGVVIYCGSIERGVKYFTRSPATSFPLTPTDNLYDYFIEIASIRRCPAGSDTPVIVEALAENYRRLFSPESVPTTQHFSIREVNSSSRVSYMDSMSPKSYRKNTPMATDSGPSVTPRSLRPFLVLCSRELHANLQNTRHLRWVALSHTIAVFVLSLVYFQQGVQVNGGSVSITIEDDHNSDSLDTASRSTVAFLYFVSLYSALSNMPYVWESFVSHVLIQREIEAVLYSPISFWLAVTISRVPIITLRSVLTCSMTYAMVGLRASFLSFAIYLTIIWLLNWWAMCLALSLGLYITAPPLGLAAYSSLIIFLSLFAGFVIKLDDLAPVYRHWLPLISPMRWAFESLVKNEFSSYEHHDVVYDFYRFSDDGISVRFSLLLLGLWLIASMTLFLIAAAGPSTTCMPISQPEISSSSQSDAFPQISRSNSLLIRSVSHRSGVMSPFLTERNNTEPVMDTAISRTGSSDSSAYSKMLNMNSPSTGTPEDTKRVLLHRSADYTSSHIRMSSGEASSFEDKLQKPHRDQRESLPVVYSVDTPQSVSASHRVGSLGRDIKLNFDIVEIIHTAGGQVGSGEEENFSVSPTQYRFSSSASRSDEIVAASPGDHKDLSRSRILQNITGSILSGELTLVMGPRGAGEQGRYL
jgi:hypothetical protein